MLPARHAAGERALRIVADDTGQEGVRMADSVDELFDGRVIVPVVDSLSPDPVDETSEIPDALDGVTLEDAPEPETAPEPEPEPEAPKEEEQRTIPLATALQWRDEAKELKRWKEQQEAQQKRPEQSAPDPFDDPAGFAAYQEQRVEQRLTQERFAMSDTIARQTHGPETVEAAVVWAQERAQQDPMFAGSYMRQPHPIDWIVQQHKRDALLSDIGDNPDDWFTREAAKRGYAPQSAPTPAPAAVVPTPASPPARVPRSLASQGSAPSDVRQTATGPLAGVDALFG